MRIAIYSRVSTGHQVEHQTIEQQIERLTAHVGTHAAKGWTLDPAQVFRDDGYSGASLARPGLWCQGALSVAGMPLEPGGERLGNGPLGALGRAGEVLTVLWCPWSVHKLIKRVHGVLATAGARLVQATSRGVTESQTDAHEGWVDGARSALTPR